MSILIRGMEIPKEGFITITVTSDGRVVGNSKKENGKFEYLDNEDIAKAVPVPPHGDLIDHNALKIAVMDCDPETRLDFLKHAMDCINKAPVVIPSDMPLFEAEEGE